MNARILLDETFLHGTPTGYTDGCHGSRCPSPIPCRDVHRRYSGDFAFHRQIDAGVTAETIVAREREAAKTVTPRAPRARRPPVAPDQPRLPVTPLQAAVDKYVREGLTDREVGERIGRTRDQAAATRKWLQLACNRQTRQVETNGGQT